MATIIGSDEPEILNEFYAEFIAKSEPIVVAMKEACEVGDLAGVGAAAHKLKSSAKTVGAVAMAACCERLEVASKAENRQVVTDSIPELECHFERFDAWFQGQLEGLA